jgi:NAD(P)H-dependent FMN reductase
MPKASHRNTNRCSEGAPRSAPGHNLRQSSADLFPSANTTVISVIVGSTREGRFSEKPAKWILHHLEEREGVDARLLDLRNFAMPFFDQPVTPATPGRPPFQHPVVHRWTAAIAQSDGFVFVTPEYNYGPAAVLKNAIDWVYPEWNRKAACFVSYGSMAGTRTVQQLRETVIELQFAPVRSSVHIPAAILRAHNQGADVDAALAELGKHAEAMIDDLLWWTAALKTARVGVSGAATAPTTLLPARFQKEPQLPLTSQVNASALGAGDRAAPAQPG